MEKNINDITQPTLQTKQNRNLCQKIADNWAHGICQKKFNNNKRMKYSIQMWITSQIKPTKHIINNITVCGE